MKQAMFDTSLIFDEKTKEFIGVNLGWDHTAEHEWGIGGIKKAFGIYDTDFTQQEKLGFFNKNKKKYGLDRLTISNIPDDFFMFDVVYSKQKYSVLTLKGGRKYLTFNSCGTLKSSEFMEHFRLPLWLFDKPNQTAIAAWDMNSFAICVKFENKKYLTELYKYFLEKDIVIYVGGSPNPFSNAGLMIMIKSKIAPIYGQQFIEQDLYQEKLNNDVKKTHIIEKLEKANKQYYALAPKYDSNGNLVFFLNPKEQNKYNHGWFTVNDLLLWTQNKGPIIKQN